MGRGMTVGEVFYSGLAFTKALMGFRTPLAVSYIITNRCNYSCAYCARWRTPLPELTTDQVRRMMDELKTLGTRFFQITGGEPFLRDDLHEVVRHGKQCGFHIGLNTNGSLLDRNPEALQYIDSVALSLDGDCTIHETVRPPGSFDTVLAAIDTLKGRGIPVQITTTLTAHNTGSVDGLVDLAAGKDVAISFQPSSPQVLSGDEDNPEAGDREEIVRALSRVAERGKEDKRVGNSAGVLRFMQMWPYSQDLTCAGGRLFYRINCDGDVLVCGRDPGEGPHPNVARDGVRQALHKVPSPKCGTCYNTTRLRVNMIYSLLTLNGKVWSKLIRGGRKP